MTGVVSGDKLTVLFSLAVFEVRERSAQRADDAGIERWAVAADGIKGTSLSEKIDPGSLEPMIAEQRTEAVEWAKRA